MADSPGTRTSGQSGTSLASQPAALPEARDASAASEWAVRRDAILTPLLWVFLIGIILWVLSHVMRVVLLLAISGIIAFALDPVAKFLSRFLPRFLAIVIVYILVLGALGGLGYLVVSAAITEVSSLTTQVHDFVSSGPSGAPSPLVKNLLALGISQQQINGFTNQIISQAQSAVPLLGQFLNGTLNILIDIVLVLVLSIYLLADGERAGKWMRANAPLRYRVRVTFLINTIQRVIGGYIRGQLFLSSVIGLLVGLGMFLLQVPYAILLGLLAFALEFIPTVGTLTSGVVCILVAATQSWLLALLVLAYFVVVHVLEGYILAPRVLGKAVGLHPAISIMALVAGADLFGIWGAIFAAPLAGLIQVLLATAWREWRELHPQQFPEVFGPALVPVTTAQALGVEAPVDAGQPPLT
jgi:predicted PurR-regulated permease PerM